MLSTQLSGILVYFIIIYSSVDGQAGMRPETLPSRSNTSWLLLRPARIAAIPYREPVAHPSTFEGKDDSDSLPRR